MSQTISAEQVKTIIFACEAGMGSSLMSVNSLKKKLKAAQVTNVVVVHKPAREIPADAQVVVVHKGLAKTARAKAPNAVVVAFHNQQVIPMPILSKDRISLQANAVDKVDAIRKAGELLVTSGCVLPEYVDGMLTREQSMSTSLGNGVSIPHGVYENRDHILHTGISVLQLKDGVEWDEGEQVYMVIGIAASADEHVGVLSNLADVIDDEDALAELLKTSDPDVILKYLGEKQPS
jgi:mannitol/fructose-specific phosphotransferase system IIA component/galactitol-specific phosphotransferase system IIB component